MNGRRDVRSVALLNVGAAATKIQLLLIPKDLKLLPNLVFDMSILRMQRQQTWHRTINFLECKLGRKFVKNLQNVFAPAHQPRPAA